MRTTFKTSISALALIAAMACMAVMSANALANTGGAPSPSTSTPASTIHTTGIATWFGPGFYGKQTACGQTLTPSVLGVANRTLPCGTLVKVSYKGHVMTVPVLDRGPYSQIGADWDLTAGAAQALGITETVRIGTHLMGSAPNTPTLGVVQGAQGEGLAGGAFAA